MDDRHMILFIIIVILVLVTWYSVRAHFHYKKNSHSSSWDNHLHIETDILISWIENITIKHTLLAWVENDLSMSMYGNKSYIRTLIAAYIAQWHVIIQWPPGTWKTSLVKAFSRACDLSYSRIQCTPDLLPQDILWNEMLQSSTSTLEYQKWPIFSHVVHVDEINRTTPKLQSAFLEAMQEWQISIFGKTYTLPKPFFLVATQNPYDALGTYMLPYAQIDRFMVGISTSHLSNDTELQLVRDTHKKDDNIYKTHMNIDTISSIQAEVQNIAISDSLLEYCVACVQQFKKAWFSLSVRTTKSLISFAKALAYLQWHSEVSKDDVVMAILPVVKHRIDYLASMVIENQAVYKIILWSLQKDDIVG